ncbi:hypothetical protein K1719_034558 [Acacia pycnantha]|nr:hypothetical protein K1719_034558 [Acacia pycnantha]
MWLWVNPKRLERALRNQGLEADPYRFWFGDLIQMVKMQQQAKSLALPNHSHDLAPHVFSFVHYVVNKHGKNSFMWLGPIPRLILMDPALLKICSTKITISKT